MKIGIFLAFTFGFVAPVLAAPLTSMPAAANFANLHTNQTAKQTLAVMNTSGGALMIDSVAVTADAASFSATPASQPPIALADGDSVNIDVLFAPASTGVHLGALTIKPANGAPLVVALN